MVDEEWQLYLKLQAPDRTFAYASTTKHIEPDSIFSRPDEVQVHHPGQPRCDELTISTKTKALFLNQEVDIDAVFWDIPILPYWKPESGVVKKQMKIVCKSPQELEVYQQRLGGLTFYREHIIRQIYTENVRRVKYLDERKLSVGISQKDVLNARVKPKNAFYNCFVLILRIIPEDGEFREIHVKLFNTGKMEIPGILNSKHLDIVKTQLLEVLRPHMEREREDEVRGGLQFLQNGLSDRYTPKPVRFLDNEESDGVLINSNFNCGFHIDRDRLFALLRSETYGLEAAYDGCSYPGIKCKFYFNHDLGFDAETQRGVVDARDRSLKMSELGKTNKYTEVSFMIFRTGSCLIVGNCSESVLRFVYEFIKCLLTREYAHICCQSSHVLATQQPNKQKPKRPRKKKVDTTQAYRQEQLLVDDE